MLTGQVEQTNKDILKYRKQLHFAIQNQINKWGWVVNDDTTEIVKRAFLWLFYNVETTKALSIEKLLDAKLQAGLLGETFITDYLKIRNDNFHINNFRRASEKQQARIKRIAFYVVKIGDNQKFLDYMKETINRSVTSVRAITINEANLIIKRLERWEAKILLKK